MGRANSLNLIENLIFDFKVCFDVSGGKLCFVNTDQFWFEHYPTRQDDKVCAPRHVLKKKQEGSTPRKQIPAAF